MIHIFLILFLSVVFPFTLCSLLCSGISESLLGSTFATKTGYFSAIKDLSYWKEYYEKTQSCSPIHVWFLARHGTRYPIKEDYRTLSHLSKLSEAILYNHLQGRGCLSENEVFEFKQWLPPYEPRDQGQLHETGTEELYEMGVHWKELFPTIFSDPYSVNDIKVEFTIRNRTGQSAYHFLRGMYGDDEIGKIRLPIPFSPNFILRFYKECPRWMKEVYRNKETYQERTLFEESQDFQRVLHAVSERLGYVHPIENEDLIAMYDECRYERAWWAQRSSIWCIPFSKEDIEVLEYHQDLKYYYEDMYGFDMNEAMACKTVGDLLKRLRRAVEDEMSRPKGVLYFSHDKALLHFYSSLGLFKNELPLRHDNFHLQRNRTFISSVVGPFATNIGFALFRCDTEHKVVTFFQGNPIPLSHVCSDLLCDWERFSEDLLSPIHENCDLSKTCMLHDEL